MVLIVLYEVFVNILSGYLLDEFIYNSSAILSVLLMFMSNGDFLIFMYGGLELVCILSVSLKKILLQKTVCDVGDEKLYVIGM